MKKSVAILLIVWMLFRLLFHSFSFENSKIAEFLYFGGNNIALICLFALLHKLVKWKIKRLIKVGIVYAGFCLFTDILMLSGIGAHDFWLYTAISVSILAIGLLWSICV